MKTSDASPPIAVVGLGCWYPGARNPLQLWEGVLARRREFRAFPDRRLPRAEYYDPDPRVPDKTYCANAAFIDGFDFDWAGRRIPRSTFETTDVAQWLALEVALRTAEDAGYTPETLPAETTGVVLGNTLTGEQSRTSHLRARWPFVRRAIRAAAAARGLDRAGTEDLIAATEQYYKSVFPAITEDHVAGMLANTIAGRVANFLDLKGGGYTVDAACASSLLAVATAADTLAAGRADLMLAGGVDIALDTFEIIGFAKVGALSHTEIRPFDKRGDGFVPGEGCGMVALKRLDDARRDGDRVYAVLRGWGVSSDGRGGITAPNATGQARAIRRALQSAGGHFPVDFVECHGTGTRAGDKTEAAGLAAAYGGGVAGAEAQGSGAAGPYRSIGVGSVKSVVGHTKAAAGAAGLIKATIAVNRRVLPPTAGCTEPNPVFETAATDFYPIMLGERRPADATLRTAVSAFGFGGINTHVLLESGDAPAPALAPPIDERALLVSNQDTEIFALDGDSPADLLKRLGALRDAAAGISAGELVDLARDLAAQLTGGPLRAALLAGTPQELAERIAALERLVGTAPPARPDGWAAADPREPVWLGRVPAAGPPRVGFALPGQGSQRLNAARVLIERYAWARELARTAERIFEQAGVPGVLDALLRPLDRAVDAAQVAGWTAELARTQLAQPAIALASVLWAQRLARLGIRPSVVVGHSLGELTGLHLAGALTAEQLFRAVAARGLAMAAGAQQAGAMASLACDRGRAEALLARCAGYVVVANINTLTQTVVSGERAAVEQAVALAGAEGIQARLLPVSNAFHSRLVADAGEVFAAAADLPATVPSSDVRVLSTMLSADVRPGLGLRDHLVRQIATPVDFVSATERLAEHCDVVFEAGPGRVLSNLIGHTTDGRLPAFPVEGTAGADRDLNTAVAQAFLRGVAIDWTELYAERLVRPFVPAAERIFIENYCERPFRVDQAAIEAAEAPKADATWTVPLEREPALAAAPAIVPAAVAAQPVRGAEARLIELVSERTGYPVDRISGDARLLDDLNLDSIKSGELIAGLAREFGAGGLVEPAALANATIAEIAAAVDPSGAGASASAGPVAAPVPAPQSTEAAPDVISTLIDLVAARTGYPKDSIPASARLQDDLQLDSIKSGELIAEAARTLGAGPSVDPVSLANASLTEIAQLLAPPAAPVAVPAPVPVQPVERPAPAAPTQNPAERPGWVREFVIDYVERPADPTPGAAGQWQGAEVLVLCADDAQDDVAAALGTELRVLGAAVQHADFARARREELGADPRFSHLIAVLPDTVDPARPAPDRLADAVARLRSIALAPHRPAGQAPATVAYVQRGGGRFGHDGPAVPYDQASAYGFAASLHLERPDLRVRVIDVPDRGQLPDAAALAPRVLAELAAPDAFAAAGFDTGLVRRVPQPRLLEKRQWRRRGVSWPADEVLLFTGGAKGITAELALAAAKGLRMRIALVGSSAFDPADPRTPAAEQIAHTLQRFAKEGLTARYYRCDLTDAGAVRALVEQVSAHYGAIRAVIHGAAVNRAALIPQSDEAAAAAETAPKVLGALNLCAALESAPPRLFVGLSSVLELTGLAGNGWYAFSNEALSLIIRQFAARHAQTEGLTVPFTVWSDTGMGHRMGSVAHLAKLGVSAVRPAEAVARFLRVFGHDPGADRVAVTSRVGLSTWRPAAPPAADRRFLEQLVAEEPGVEVIARARLDTERDRYMPDHTFRGTCLFPTVFGLEAMGQAVARVTGRTELGPLVVEQVKLERPIVVHPGSATVIEVRATVREQAGGPPRVDAVIGTEQTGFATPHFSATFVLEAPEPVADRPAPGGHPALPVDPAADLYGNLLFQGPLYQRIEAIHELERAADATGGCLFRARCEPKATTLDGLEGTVVLGDAYYRDALLQSFQLSAGARICLPVEIRRLEVHVPGGAATWGRNRVHGFADGKADTTLYALDDEGRVLERFVGCGFRQIGESGPQRAGEAPPAPLTRSLLADQARRLGIDLPGIALATLPGLGAASKDERHATEAVLVDEAVSQWKENAR
jgi:enediyne polyketide synthase